MLPDGKVAIITGGAHGLGRGFAEILLKNGAKVCICDVNSKQGEETVSEFQKKYGAEKAIFVKCDVRSQEQFEEVFKRTKEAFGGIDIVCNNAGIGGEASPTWEKCVDINIKGLIRGTNLALDYLRKDKGGNGGVIVNMASAGGLRPNPFSPVYCATKSAAIQFTRCWAINPLTAQNDIRVNLLCPTFVDTPMVKGIDETNCLNVDAAKQFIDTIGVMSVEECAEAFLELITDDNRTGVILKVSKESGKQYCTVEPKFLE